MTATMDDRARVDDAGSDGPAVIETAALTKHYGDTVAVDHLDLTIGRGEVFGLLGPNGAGKTTTILMLLGLTERTAGSALVAGLDPARQPLAVKSRVGYLPDEVGFYEDLSARENLRFTARLNRIDRARSERRIDTLLADVGLADSGDARVGTFSRGMRQRLGLADALVKDPSILILDEPTVNIDPEGVREILLLVEQLRTEQGVTILLSSHLLHQVQQVCDRIGIFVSGRMVACGTIDELTSTLDDRWSFRVAVADVRAPEELIRSIDGVEAVDPVRDSFLVTARSDIRAELTGAVATAGGHLTGLSREGADLDALYHHYFEGATDGRDRVA